MDYVPMKFWFDAVQTIAMAAIGGWIYLSNRVAARKAEVDGQISGLQNRMTVVEQKIKAAPDHDDLHEIYKSIENTNKTLNTLLGEFQAVRRSLDLINQYLLTQKKK
jgi:hypothetical protein